MRHAQLKLGARRRRRESGQTLVEFALVFPIFLFLLLAIIEFAFVFSAVLGISYASRNAALIAAEAGNATPADCIILDAVDRSVSAPADRNRITKVDIYWADTNGATIGSNVNTFTRGGSYACTLPDLTTMTVPYTRTANGYPPSDRCNVLAGAAGGCVAGHTSLDTIGVKITYQHTWVTPLAGLGGPGGSGLSVTQSNAMRMEPIL